MKTSITAKDIAKMVGCSVSTVSKALKDNHEISEATKQKIHHLAQLYDYRPNKNALSLRSGKKYSIGIIIPSFEDPFFSRVIHGVEDHIVDTEYTLTTAVTRESLEREKSVLRKMFDNVDGLILGLSKETLELQDIDHIKAIVNAKKPLVLIDRTLKGIKANTVIPDAREVIEQIDAELKKFESKKNLIITSSPENSLTGMVDKYFEESGNIIGNSDGRVVSFSDETVVESELETRLKQDSPDTVIALDQMATLAAFKVARKLNLSIPQDLRIIGCVPEKIAGMFTPPITTIDLHRKTIGKNAIDIILSELKTIGQDERIPTSVNINSSLVRRNSF